MSCLPLPPTSVTFSNFLDMIYVSKGFVFFFLSKEPPKHMSYSATYHCVLDSFTHQCLGDLPLLEKQTYNASFFLSASIISRGMATPMLIESFLYNVYTDSYYLFAVIHSAAGTILGHTSLCTRVFVICPYV